MARCHDWIEDCVLNHPQCERKSGDRNFYPTRLLRIDETGCKSWSLVLTGPDCDRSTPWMTLSHRWSSWLRTKLTSTNVADLQQEQPMTRLPTVFQDAMFMARQLGVSYIWIDALCIIQDSQPDWQKESALMQYIYSGSICNISSCGSQDNQQPFFRHRHPDVSLTRTVQLEWAPTEGGYAVLDMAFWDEHVHERPLNRRAWVFQERLLSPRLLHFSQDQILFECRMGVASEFYPSGLPKSYMTQSFTNFKSLAVFGLEMGSGQRTNTQVQLDSLIGVYQYWTSLVEVYSRCHMTRAEDKLIALSGVARIFQDKLADTYLAGLWKGWFFQSLMWRCSALPGNSFTNARRDPSHRAPSWSWASIDGPIFYDDDAQDWAGSCSIARFLSANIDLVNPKNPTGQVVNANLTLLGYKTALPAGLLYSVEDRIDLENGEGRIAKFLDPAENIFCAEVCLLPLLHCCVKSPRTKVLEPVVDGLILAGNPGADSWWRIGIFSAFGHVDCRALGLVFDEEAPLGYFDKACLMRRFLIE